MLFDLKKKAIFVMGLNPLVFSKIFEKRKIKLFSDLNALTLRKNKYDIVMHFLF